LGIYKPSQRVYRHAMQKLQIQDALAVAQFGFQVVRLERSGGHDKK
jgi:hypothetical protein